MLTYADGPERGRGMGLIMHVCMHVVSVSKHRPINTRGLTEMGDTFQAVSGETFWADIHHLKICIFIFLFWFYISISLRTALVSEKSL